MVSGKQINLLLQDPHAGEGLAVAFLALLVRTETCAEEHIAEGTCMDGVVDVVRVVHSLLSRIDAVGLGIVAQLRDEDAWACVATEEDTRDKQSLVASSHAFGRFSFAVVVAAVCYQRISQLAVERLRPSSCCHLSFLLRRVQTRGSRSEGKQHICWIHLGFVS